MWLTMERMGRLLPHALCQQGFGTEKVGVFAFDDPANRAVVDEVLVPALNRCGSVQEVYYAEAELHTIGRDTASAVLRFRTAGVDRVVMFASGGGAFLFFANQAESQGYRPWYGISTYDRPAGIVENIPEEQRANIYGAGFWLYGDISPSQMPPLSVREQQCFDVLNARTGDSLQSRADGGEALGICDLFWSSQQALGPMDGKSLTREDVPDLFARLGDTYPPVILPAARWGRDRSDAVEMFAPLRWDAGDCQCLEYDTGWQRIPFG